MFKLTGFGDEISEELEEQLKVLSECGISYLELRGVWGKNVADLSRDDILRVKEIVEKNNFNISCIASPIGKINIKDDFNSHLEDFHKMIEFSKILGSRYIRIFSYYIPEGEEPEKYRDEVMRRIEEKTKIAEKEGVILLLENDHGIYGDSPERVRDILDTVNSKSLRCLFDMANFVVDGFEPYPHGYSLLKDYIEYVHIKDAIYTPGKVTILPPGEGNAKIKEILRELKNKNYDGFISLEPHLALAESQKGFSGPELFKKACSCLKKIIEEI